MTKEELMAEEHICNGKCQDDITRNYVHCKTCTRLKDFLAGYKAGKAELEKENAELSMKRKAERKIFQGIVEKKNDQLTNAKEVIRELIYADGRFADSYPQLINRAEQFLKDSEVEE